MSEIPEEIMIQRRLERLNHLVFFMRDERVPQNGRRVFALSASHNLLMGFFSNSYWQTAWWCVKQAAENSWQVFTITCRFWYWQRILRLNEAQIDERLLRDFD